MSRVADGDADLPHGSSPWLTRAGLLLVLALFLAFGIGYNAKTPKWNAPEEPAHYNYIRSIAEDATLPVLKPGDWNLEYQSDLISKKFPPGSSIDGIRYEAHQPPLYYLLLTPVYSATAPLGQDAQVAVLRFISTLFGAATVLMVYLIGRELFLRRRWMAVLAAACAAMVPMFCFINASISNDSLANLVASATVFACLRTLRHSKSQDMPQVSRDSSKQGTWWIAPALLGVLLGVALLTKVTIYMTIVIVALTLFWRSRECGRPKWRRFGASCGIALGIALAISGWWFVRNAVVYGGLDFAGIRFHDQVVVGQPLSGTWTWDTVRHLFTTTFQSFWAQFGWMGIPADGRTFAVYATLTVVAGLGLGLLLWRVASGRTTPTLLQWQALSLCLLCFVLAVAGHVWWNLTYVQAQGRYLFPGLSAVALLIMLGWSQLAPARLRLIWAPILPVALLVLNAYCLLRVLAPAFGT